MSFHLHINTNLTTLLSQVALISVCKLFLFHICYFDSSTVILIAKCFRVFITIIFLARFNSPISIVSIVYFFVIECLFCKYSVLYDYCTIILSKFLNAVWYFVYKPWSNINYFWNYPFLMSSFTRLCMWIAWRVKMLQPVFFIINVGLLYWTSKD